MVGVLSWRPFQEIVDEAERYLAKVGLNSRYGFLFDTSGDRVIAHKLRDPDVLPYGNILGMSVSRDFTLPQVAEAARHARGAAFEYDFPPGTKKFAVFAAVDPQNSDQAFAFDRRLGDRSRSLGYLRAFGAAAPCGDRRDAGPRRRRCGGRRLAWPALEPIGQRIYPPGPRSGRRPLSDARCVGEP
jgi:hypothetical protein